MNIRTIVTASSRKLLGVRIAPSDQGWAEMKSLVLVYGADKVATAFEDWAKTCSTPPRYPLSSFIRVADGLLSGRGVTQEHPELQSLITRLVSISDKKVFWDKLRTSQLNVLLTTFSVQEVENAFVVFWESIKNNSYYIQYASKTFIDVAPQFINVGAPVDYLKQLRAIHSSEHVEAAFAEYYKSLAGLDYLTVRKAICDFPDVAEQIMAIQIRRKREAAGAVNAN